MYKAYTNMLPDGYRWATAEEAEHWTANGELTRAELWVQVGEYDGNTAWDLAVPTDFVFTPPEKTCPPTLTLEEQE